MLVKSQKLAHSLQGNLDNVERTAPRFTGLYAIGRGFVRVGVICAQ